MAAHVIDDFTRPHPSAATGTDWEFLSDRVMGGVSGGGLSRETVAGRTALRLTGDVRLDNNGGFVQAALDLAPGGAAIDARGFAGITLDVLGQAEDYNLHLRTADVTRPWQSYRAAFAAPPTWTRIDLPFSDFTPHRLDAPFDLSTLRRIGLVAIGRAFRADLSVARIGFLPREG
ncbi:CIA30 family protein [Meridianimarinicoccus sp. RP-17]|uniref:CIA30 family protein n=1 Tax=Meridianimarinicoccus zhengii TaxID=2056810 RepID=UPI000DACCD78|nr:CIA30 family protein [Phycocomes zhengii]